MKRKPTLVKLFNLQGGFCAFCERPMDLSKTNSDDAPTVEHLLPKSRFKKLAKDPFNLVCACRKCNNDKGDMSFAVFFKRRSLYND
jgi:5-methylcytosine-specific restriction endonuclease McrA